MRFVLDTGEVEVLLSLKTIARGGPVPAKLVERFHDRKARELHTSCGGAIVPQVGFAFDEGSEVVDMGLGFVGCLGGYGGILRGDKREL